MKIREAVNYLSERHFDCSPATVRALVREGRLRCYRGPTGKGPMQFPPAELDRFLVDGLTGGNPVLVPVQAPSLVMVDNWRRDYQKVKGA